MKLSITDKQMIKTKNVIIRLIDSVDTDVKLAELDGLDKRWIDEQEKLLDDAREVLAVYL